MRQKKIRILLLTMCLLAGLLLAIGERQSVWAQEPRDTMQPEPVELLIENVTFSAENPGAALVEEAVNRITEPAIGVRIRLLNVSIAQHVQQIGQMIAGGEPLDLVMAGLTYPMTNMAADGLLLPLNELLSAYGADLPPLYGERIQAGYIGETLYALPAKISSTTASGMLYNTQMAQAAGVTVPDPCTAEELDAVFAAIKEQFPEVYATSFISREVSTFNFMYELESYGSGTYAFGVTFAPWENRTIENLYASEQYLQFCEKMQEWQQKGFLPPNLMTSTVLPSERLLQGQTFSLFTGYSPLNEPNELLGDHTALVRVTEAMDLTGLIQERMWGIPITSRHPEKAMAFLNLLYTDPDLANLLMNGVEGIHYTKLSEHVIRHTDNRDYQRVFTVFGDQRQICQWYPAAEDILSAQAAFEQNAKISATLGYVFDSSAVSREVEAVNEVLALYTPPLECGLVEDVKEAIEELNRELEKAGIDRIIAENQKQLQAWQEKQP